VSFIGVYSTQTHPFALVFELMNHFNLGEYIRNNHDVGRVELVCFSSPCQPLIVISAPRHQVLGIARAVEYMHNLNVVHGNLKIVGLSLPPWDHALTFFQTNILVDADGRARVAGLGATSITSTVPREEVDTFFHGAAPELIEPQRFRLTSIGATAATDVYAFGVLAFEVSRGRARC
jgi:serine/threonine protein kinase